MFHSIIFDLDGTLVDSYPAILESLNQVLKAFHKNQVDMETAKKLVGKGLENLISQVIGSEDINAGVKAFRASYDETHRRGTFLLPGVLPTLEALHQKRIKMSVASNKPSDYSRNILEHLRINYFFVDCYGPDRGVPPKPEPAMLKTLMRLMDSSTEETLYVGDMVLDVQTARNAGVRVALIPTGGGSEEELRSAQPDFMLSSFSDLLKLVW